MHNDAFCEAMADAEDVPEKTRVPRRARLSIAQSAVAFMKQHGHEYATKEEATAAFQAQYQRERSRASANEKPGHTNVVGFSILASIIASIISFIIQRWWERNHPNK